MKILSFIKFLLNETNNLAVIHLFPACLFTYQTIELFNNPELRINSFGAGMMAIMFWGFVFLYIQTAWEHFKQSEKENQ
ncbi:MAG: hypothetical protein IJG33_03125 [Selenomonadaceae bacterium]|nr:hypothetical protein [Selenomonadaceae bacterium]